MKKLSTVFAKVFEQLGIKCAFGISGGAILHFVDSLYHETSIKTIFSTNEMFSAFEADGVSRCSNSVGLCFATSGPGMSNLITGIATSYYDSVTTIVVTGQVSSKRRNTGLNIKQYGFQEAENCKMMESISIYTITNN